MNARHLQAKFAEETPLRDGVAARIAERLDASVTGRGHFAHDAFKVIGELGAQRIELQGERRDLCGHQMLPDINLQDKASSACGGQFARHRG